MFVEVRLAVCEACNDILKPVCGGFPSSMVSHGNGCNGGRTNLLGAEVTRERKEITGLTSREGYLLATLSFSQNILPLFMHRQPFIYNSAIVRNYSQCCYNKLMAYN